MRVGLVGLLLSYAMMLAQSNTGSSGQLTVSSVDVTSGSSVSSDHLRAITEEIAKHTYPANQPGEEIAERARYELQHDGNFKAEVRLANQLVSPTQSTVAVTLEINGIVTGIDHRSAASYIVRGLGPARFPLPLCGARSGRTLVSLFMTALF